MSKAVKGMIVDDLKARYSGVNSACLVDLTGLDVASQEKLRSTLRKKSGRLEVLRNSLARRAFRGGPLAPLAEAMQGPCALVTANETPMEVAKTLLEVVKEFAKLKLKLAIFDGDPNLMSIEALSKIKGRIELLGEVAMLLSSPGRALAGCLSSPQAKIAGCLKAIVEKGDAVPEAAIAEESV